MTSKTPLSKENDENRPLNSNSKSKPLNSNSKNLLTTTNQKNSPLLERKHIKTNLVNKINGKNQQLTTADKTATTTLDKQQQQKRTSSSNEKRLSNEKILIKTLERRLSNEKAAIKSLERRLSNEKTINERRLSNEKSIKTNSINNKQQSNKNKTFEKPQQPIKSNSSSNDKLTQSKLVSNSTDKLVQSKSITNSTDKLSIQQQQPIQTKLTSVLNDKQQQITKLVNDKQPLKIVGEDLTKNRLIIENELLKLKFLNVRCELKLRKQNQLVNELVKNMFNLINNKRDNCLELKKELSLKETLLFLIKLSNQSIELLKVVDLDKIEIYLNSISNIIKSSLSTCKCIGMKNAKNINGNIYIN